MAAPALEVDGEIDQLPEAVFADGELGGPAEAFFKANADRQARRI